MAQNTNVKLVFKKVNKADFKLLHAEYFLRQPYDKMNIFKT